MVQDGSVCGEEMLGDRALASLPGGHRPNDDDNSVGMKERPPLMPPDSRGCRRASVVSRADGPLAATAPSIRAVPAGGIPTQRMDLLTSGAPRTPRGDRVS